MERQRGREAAASHVPPPFPWEWANGNGEWWQWETGFPISTIPHSRLPIPTGGVTWGGPLEPRRLTSPEPDAPLLHEPVVLAQQEMLLQLLDRIETDTHDDQQ